MIKKLRMKPIHFIPLSFLGLILIGTLFLMTPYSSATGEVTDFVTALFTSTTSVCVTGLVVVDTFSHWSDFGQLIIMLLIQIGGLGVVTVGALVMFLGKVKFTLGNRVLLEDSLNVERKRELRSFLLTVIRGVFIIEGIGAGLYMIEFIPMLGTGKGIQAAIFQSVSAFCNAGMDIVGPNSMMDFNDNPLLMWVTMALIVLGGIGFVVWVDIWDVVKEGIKKKFGIKTIFRRFSEHTKIVVIITFALIAMGTFIVMLAEYNNPKTLGNMDFGDKLLNSMFQSITFRTAGFASISQSDLSDITILCGCVLMFIGGSPVGTAGGVKTVTAFLFLMNAVSYVIGRKEVTIFKRRVTGERMRKASAIVFINLLIAMIMTLLLMSGDGIDLSAGLYEVFSALGTVGLSKGLTPNLDDFGRIVITLTMYLGRVGPISMAIFFAPGNDTSNKIKHSEGNFYVG